MLKYILTYNDQTITLTGSDLPVNANNFSLNLTRHKIYGSVLRSYTISEEFHGDGKAFIDAIINGENGLNAEIRIDVYAYDSSTFSYLTIIENGRVNLDKYVQKETTTKVNFEDGSFESKLLNRDEQQINITNNTTIDEGNIAGYAIELVPLLLRGETDSLIQAYYPRQAFERLIAHCTGSKYGLNVQASPVFNEIKYRMIATGRMIRNFNIELPNITMSFSDLFQTYSSQYCLGLGFLKEAGESKVIIDRRESFYPSYVTVEITNISDLENSFDDEQLFTELQVGYRNYDKKESEKGQAEFNNKATYSNSLSHFKKKLSILAPYRADGTSIERLRQLGTSSDKSDNLDNSIFIIDSLIDDDDALVSRKVENFSTVSGIYGNYNLHINLMLAPVRMLKRWGAFLASAIKDRSKYLIFQDAETLSALSTKTDTEFEFATEGENIQGSKLAEPILTGRVIKFNCTFDALLINSLVARPNGLIKFYDYINNSYNFGYIKEVRISPVDQEHNVELLEAATTADVVTEGYLIQENGEAILLENGGLIKLEDNMPQIPTKISSLEDAPGLNDTDLVVITANGMNYKGTIAQLKSVVALDLEGSITLNLPSDMETTINVGAYTVGQSNGYEVTYNTNRYNAKWRTGKLIIKATGATTAGIVEFGTVVMPEGFDNTGGIFGFRSDVDNGQVRLMITTDNSDIYDTVLWYKIKSI